MEWVKKHPIIGPTAVFALFLPVSSPLAYFLLRADAPWRAHLSSIECAGYLAVAIPAFMVAFMAVCAIAEFLRRLSHRRRI